MHRAPIRSTHRAVIMLTAALLLATAVPAAYGHGISGGPLGPQQVDGPVGTALDAATADRCDPIDPAACLLPFPNDHFTRSDDTTDTGKRLDLDVLSMPRNIAGKPIDPTEWNRNDGFSPGQLVVVKVPGLSADHTLLPPITDPGVSLTPASAVTVLEVDPSGERPPRRHPVWAELDASVDGTYGGGEIEGLAPPESPELHDPANGQALLIRPAVNWKENHRYVVVLRDMRDAASATIPRNATFAALSDDRITIEDSLFAARKEHLDDRVWPVIDRARPKIARQDVWLAWDFTVASERNLSERVLHMRDDAFDTLAGAAPAYTITSVEESPHPEIRRRIQGEFEVPRYVSTPLPGARMVYDPATGLPMRQPTGQPATFTCNIPTTASAGDPARVSLYGHGLLGGQSEINSDAETNFGILHNWAFCATDWTGMASKDLVTILTQVVPDLSNFHLIPDRSQQGFLSFLWLGRMIAHPDGFTSDPAFQDASGQSLVDTSELVYYGNSQGGIMGGALTAIATDFEKSILGVTGMNYSTLLRRSKDFDPFAALLYLNYADELDRSIIFSLMQILWDRGEANGYAHHMTDDPLPGTPPHRVLLHTGFGDHQVANVSAEVEARTIGASVHRPEPPAYVGVPFWGLPTLTYPHDGSALVVWDSGTPAPPLTNTPPRDGRDPHETPRRDPWARLQMDHFLRNGEMIDVCSDQPHSPDGSCQTLKRDG